MQDTDRHSLLIDSLVSKSDQLDHHHNFKDAIINDPLLPLLNNDLNENLLNVDNLNTAKQTEFTYDSTYDTYHKQLHLDQKCLLPLQSTLEESYLMNNAILNSANLANLNRQQQFNALNSPCNKYIASKSNLDNRIIYSTIANTINNSIEFNDSFNGNTIQLNDNQSNGQLLTNLENENNLIEMAVNNSSAIYTMNNVVCTLLIGNKPKKYF